MKLTREDIEKIIDSLDEDEQCEYCIYNDRCSRKVTSYENGPIFPACADCHVEGWFDIETYIEEEMEMLKIERIIYNNPATIVWFADGEKVIVKCHNEEFDKEKGVAMAIVRKLMNRSEFVKLVEGGTDQVVKGVK